MTYFTWNGNTFAEYTTKPQGVKMGETARKDYARISERMSKTDKFIVAIGGVLLGCSIVFYAYLRAMGAV
jgi:hypothetical protein